MVTWLGASFVLLSVCGDVVKLLCSDKLKSEVSLFTLWDVEEVEGVVVVAVDEEFIVFEFDFVLTENK